MTSGCKQHDYDFVELVVYNIHGQSVSKMISRKRMAEAYKHGLGLWTGLCYFGIDGSPTLDPAFGKDVGFHNDFLKPDRSTLTQCHVGKGRVGHVICDVFTNSGDKVPTSPRAVAAAQLEKLDKLGLTLRSSFEIEFDVFDAETRKPFAHENMWSNSVTLQTNQDMILELIDHMATGGVDVDSVQTEYGPGQWEFTFDVQEGIKTADCAARFKDISKVFFKRRGLTSTFMAKVDPKWNGSGWHYNQSLWTKDGRNALLGDDGLSELGRHWLAGLVKHGTAITALCCPTINCYRRIASPWAPSHSDWGVDDRSRSFRVKDEVDNIYLESRIPSPACNPYMVLAAQVAAGLDGIINKLELPDSSVPQPPLPRDLGSAIQLLEADDVIVKSLGADMVKHFAFCKRTFELEPYQKLADSSDEEKLKLEQKLYYTHS